MPSNVYIFIPTIRNILIVTKSKLFEQSLPEDANEGTKDFSEDMEPGKIVIRCFGHPSYNPNLSEKWRRAHQ